jgi:hypothetical protein
MVEMAVLATSMQESNDNVQPIWRGRLEIAEYYQAIIFLYRIR